MFKNILKIAACSFAFVIFVLVFLANMLVDDLTDTKTYAYTSIESCVSDGQDKIKCEMNRDKSKELANIYQWEFADASQCAMQYLAEDCKNIGGIWSVEPVGFGWSVDGVDVLFPVFNTRNGLVAANTVPVKEGVFDIPGDPDNVSNLSKLLQPDTAICFGKRNSSTGLDYNKYKRSTIVERINKRTYKHQLMSEMMKQDSKNCRIIFGLINPDAK